MVRKCRNPLGCRGRRNAGRALDAPMNGESERREVGNPSAMRSFLSAMILFVSGSGFRRPLGFRRSVVRRCKNPWCEGTGEVHGAAFVLCPACWKFAAGVSVGVGVVHLVEAWNPRALWAVLAAVVVGVGVWFAGAWRRVNGKAAGKLESENGGEA